MRERLVPHARPTPVDFTQVSRHDAPATGTAIRWPLLLVLASLAAFAPVATDLYLPGFPAMGEALGADASGVQLTLTTFLVGLAFGQLVMGPLSDRFGRRAPADRQRRGLRGRERGLRGRPDPRPCSWSPGSSRASPAPAAW